MADGQDETLLTLTVDIVAAHVSNNSVAVADLPGLITRVHDALAGLGRPNEEPQLELKPAVSVRTSIKPDHIVCLEDGKKLKMLKRHLMAAYNMTPEQYRQRWNLPVDYPMVAPNYAAKRRDLAEKIGLGRKPGTPVAVAKQAAAAPIQTKPAAPKRRAARLKK
jgi:predicted transcriptional regulator